MARPDGLRFKLARPDELTRPDGLRFKLARLDGLKFKLAGWTEVRMGWPDGLRAGWTEIQVGRMD